MIRIRWLRKADALSGGSVASAVSLLKKNLFTGSPKKLEDQNDESSVLTILFV